MNRTSRRAGISLALNQAIALPTKTIQAAGQIRFRVSAQTFHFRIPILWV